jgi:hypothetical protein
MIKRFHTSITATCSEENTCDISSPKSHKIIHDASFSNKTNEVVVLPEFLSKGKIFLVKVPRAFHRELLN